MLYGILPLSLRNNAMDKTIGCHCRKSRILVAKEELLILN
jgi:hypothetical protein